MRSLKQPHTLPDESVEVTASSLIETPPWLFWATQVDAEERRRQLGAVSVVMETFDPAGHLLARYKNETRLTATKALKSYLRFKQAAEARLLQYVVLLSALLGL